MFENILKYINEEEDLIMFLTNISAELQLTEEEDEEISEILFCENFFDIKEAFSQTIGTGYFDEELSEKKPRDEDVKKHHREREDATKKLPAAFRPNKNDSEKEKLKKSALRGSMFRYDADLKRWVPRDKPRDFNTVLSDLKNRKEKFERGLAKRASQKAVVQRSKAEPGKKENNNVLESTSSKIFEKMKQIKNLRSE